MSPLVIAHRGYSAKYEDNTWQAIRGAFENGADICEIDLHMTKDGKTFAYHDYYLDGVRIADQDLLDLKRKAPDNPDLKELVEFMKESGRRFMFEIKDRGLLEIILSDLKGVERDLFIVSSFDGEFLKNLKSADPEIKTCLLLGTVLGQEDALRIARSVRSDFLLPAWEARHPYPNKILSQEWVSFLKTNGVEVVSWHEEREEVLRDLLHKPLYGICTNDPPLVRKVMKEI